MTVGRALAPTVRPRVSAGKWNQRPAPCAPADPAAPWPGSPGRGHSRRVGAGSGAGPEGAAGRFLDSSLRGRGPAHRFLPKLRELTQDHRREEKRLFPPDFRLCPHDDQDPDARAAAGAPGQTQLRAQPRGRSSGPQVEPAGPPSALDWPAPRPCALRLEEAAAAPLSDSPPPGAAPPTILPVRLGGVFSSPWHL